MQFKSYLEEKMSASSVLISIDVQPIYDHALEHILPQYVKTLNSFKGRIVVFFNGPDIDGDSKEKMIYFLFESGVEEEVIQRIEFKEKVYAFFRNWMDRGMDRGHIIKAIRYMVVNRINDSRDVSEEDWSKVFGGEEGDWNEFTDIPDIVSSDMINIPDINIAELKSYKNIYLCGGGENECLAEFRLILDSFNIKYTTIKSLIY